MNYDGFKQKYIGQEVTAPDGSYPGECVSLAKQWLAWNGWPPRHGNANQWNYGDDFYTWITKSGVPIQGDLVVFDYAPYGHIGICESADANNIVLFNQNFPKGNDTNPAQINNFNYQHVMGWLRPKGANVITKQGLINLYTELRKYTLGTVDVDGLNSDVNAILNGDDNTAKNILNNYEKVSILMKKTDCKPTICPPCQQVNVNQKTPDVNKDVNQTIPTTTTTADYMPTVKVETDGFWDRIFRFFGVK